MPGLEELTRDLRSHSDEVVNNAIRSSEGVQGLAGMIVKEERDAMREAAMMQQAPQNPPTIREQMMGLPEIMPTMENVPMEAIQGIGDPNLMAMNQAMMNAPRNDQALAEGMRMGVDAVEEANRNAAMNAGIAPLPMEEEMFTAAEGGIVGFQDRGFVNPIEYYKDIPLEEVIARLEEAGRPTNVNVSPVAGIEPTRLAKFFGMKASPTREELLKRRLALSEGLRVRPGPFGLTTLGGVYGDDPDSPTSQDAAKAIVEAGEIGLPVPMQPAPFTAPHLASAFRGFLDIPSTVNRNVIQPIASLFGSEEEREKLRRELSKERPPGEDALSTVATKFPEIKTEVQGEGESDERDTLDLLLNRFSGEDTTANNQSLPKNLPRDLHDFTDEGGEDTDEGGQNRGGKDILEEVANAGNEAYGTDFWSADTLRKLMLFGGLNFAQGKPIAQSLNEGLVTIMEDKAIRDKLGLEERKVDALMDLNQEKINARKMDIKSRIGERRYDMLSAKQDFFRSVLGEQYTKEEMYNTIINKHSQKELQEMGLYTDPFWGKAEKIPYSEAPEKIRQQIEKEYHELMKGIGKEIEEVNKQQESLLEGL